MATTSPSAESPTSYEKSTADGPGLMPERSGRFLFVDALRGIAALWVVVFHAYEGKHLEQVATSLPKWATVFLGSGHFGVPIFFVLSGFVISYSVSRYSVDIPFIGRFAMRRSIRLDPPYWASMVLVVVLGLLSKIVMPSKDRPTISLDQMLAHLFYLQEILGYPAINVIYWTLALEIQFYLVFCLLMWLAHATRRDILDRRSLRAIFIPSLLLAAAWPLGLLKGNLWPGLFFPFWHGFLLGMMACWAMNGTVRPVWFYAYAALVAAGAVWTSNSFAAVCVGTAVLLLATAQAGGLRRWLGWRWLQFLGLISYSLYLIHNPVSGALYNVGYRITGRSPLTEVFWFVAMIAVNIVGAAAFWWLFERPTLSLAQRLRLQPGHASVDPAKTEY